MNDGKLDICSALEIITGLIESTTFASRMAAASALIDMRARTESHLARKDAVEKIEEVQLNSGQSDLEGNKSETPADAIEGQKERLKTKAESLKTLFIGIFVPIGLSVFTILSLQYAGIANDQSQVANQLSLLSLCSGNLVSKHGFY